MYHGATNLWTLLPPEIRRLIRRDRPFNVLIVHSYCGLYPLQRRTLFRMAALLLALTYGMFRLEPFEEEFESFHPALAGGPAIALPTVNWETFDKDNAAKAFVVTLLTSFVILLLASDERATLRIIPAQFRLLRDKSPPPTFSNDSSIVAA
jgi:hypothetical protein